MNARTVSILLIPVCAFALTGCGTGPGANPDFVYSFTDRYSLTTPSVQRIEVASHQPRAGDEQRVRNIAKEYLRSGQGKLVIFVPIEGAGALQSGNWVKQELVAQGVANSRILWDARPMPPGSVRVAFAGSVTQTAWRCSTLNEDVQQRADGTSYLNRETIDFGCAFQSNVRAQAENPNDYLRPRPETPPDPVRLANAVRALRQNASTTNNGSATTAPAFGVGTAAP